MSEKLTPPPEDNESRPTNTPEETTFALGSVATGALNPEQLEQLRHTLRGLRRQKSLKPEYFETKIKPE